MKIKAAILRESGLSTPYAQSKPLSIETISLDEPKEDEVLIKIKTAGLCHSDLSVINGSRPRPTPIALGHEATGVIVKVAPNITDFQVGDHVVCTFVPSCNRCLPCMEGRPALCVHGAKANEQGHLLSSEKKLSDDTGPIYHHLGVSGFAEYAVVSKHTIVKVDKSIPFETLALFGCAVITGIGAVTNTAKVRAGSSVAIIGMGGIGLNALLGAKLVGASEIIAIDIHDPKLHTAVTLGATTTYNSNTDNIIETILNDTNGGVDYAFDTAGVTKAMELAYSITKNGGMTVTTGLPHPNDMLSIPQVTIAAQERTIKGSYLGSCIPTRDIPTYIDLYKKGQLPIDQLITDIISLEDINEGFDRLQQGNASRIVVKIND